MCIVVIYIWKFPLGLSSGYRLGKMASALCGDIWQTAGKAGWISNISMDGSVGQVLGVDCSMKWIYWCESKSRPLLVNMQSVSITFDKLGLRPFALFAFLSTPLGNNNKRLQVVHCERLIALLMSVTDPGAQCYDFAHAIRTQKCGLLCLTSFPELTISLIQLRFNISPLH